MKLYLLGYKQFIHSIFCIDEKGLWAISSECF